MEAEAAEQPFELGGHFGVRGHAGLQVGALAWGERDKLVQGARLDVLLHKE